MSTDNWFCLVVSSQREISAVTELARIGIKSFTPTEKIFVRQHVSGLKIVRDRPLMPRYVFAANPAWYDVRQLNFRGRPLVNGVLSANGRPYLLPKHEIMSLMHLAENGPPQSIPVSRKLAPGDVCIINGGPFDGLRVKVKRDAGETRRWCELIGVSLLGKREIDVPVELLTAAA